VKHDPDQSLAMITPWNIHNGIVYNYGINDSSNEGFSITGDDNNLMLFINLRIIQLFQSGKIEELTERMFDGEFDFNKVVPNVESNCEENDKSDGFEVKNEALKSEITAADKWIMKPYFDLMDTDQDGRISEREFQQYLKKKLDFTNYNNSEIHRLFQEADLNNDGFIDLNEFIAIMKKNSGDKSNDWAILFEYIKEEYNS
jgi:hypothetical protein